MQKQRTSTDDEAYAVYDPDEALDQAGGNVSIAKELLSMMLAELPEQTLELDAAILAGDMERLARIAHRINGSACCCGTPALAAACRALRRGVLAHAEEDIPLLVELLQDQIRALLDHCDSSWSARPDQLIASLDEPRPADASSRALPGPNP